VASVVEPVVKVQTQLPEVLLAQAIPPFSAVPAASVTSFEMVAVYVVSDCRFAGSVNTSEFPLAA
jgi:hypothetical protein